MGTLNCRLTHSFAISFCLFSLSLLSSALLLIRFFNHLTSRSSPTAGLSSPSAFCCGHHIHAQPVSLTQATLYTSSQLDNIHLKPTHAAAQPPRIKAPLSTVKMWFLLLKGFKSKGVHMIILNILRICTLVGLASVMAASWALAI